MRAQREQATDDRGFEVSGFKLDRGAVVSLVPVFLVAVLWQMLALLGVVARRGVAPLDADDAWFGLFAGWTIVPMILTIGVLPVWAILTTAPRLSFGGWRYVLTFLQQIPWSLCWALVAMVSAAVVLIWSRVLALRAAALPAIEPVQRVTIVPDPAG